MGLFYINRPIAEACPPQVWLVRLGGACLSGAAAALALCDIIGRNIG